VLLPAGFHGVGNQNFHLLAAAENGNLCVMDHFNDIAAVTADCKHFHIVLLLLFGGLFFFMA
jgi:hypothetical protein